MLVSFWPVEAAFERLPTFPIATLTEMQAKPQPITKRSATWGVACLLLLATAGCSSKPADDQPAPVPVARGGETADPLLNPPGPSDPLLNPAEPSAPLFNPSGRTNPNTTSASTSGTPANPAATTGWHGWPADAPPLAVAPFDAAAAKKHQQAWANYLGLPVEKEIELPGGAKLTMVLIPPGEFLMGSGTSAAELARIFDTKAEYFKQEFPQHVVQFTKPFYLQTTEVTQGQWTAVMGTAPWKGKGFVKEGARPTTRPAT